MKNPKLLEINVRLLVRRFDVEDKRAKLPDIPFSYWKNLADLGIEIVWLMGVWETTSILIDRCCFEEYLIQSYNRTLKDWQRKDVIGSPYAIDKYEINPELGTKEDLLQLKKTLNELNILLMLDFVPNHFSAETELLKTHPDIFLEATEEIISTDRHTFYRPIQQPQRIFAHGRDPFFPAWTDTIQLNYYNLNTRKFMTETLLSIAELCDGVRCDMAMLTLNNVFGNTWGGVINEYLHPKPHDEFWQPAIAAIKKDHPNFIFMAEAYWNLEWDLQQLGFDFTYDKKLLDRLKDGTPKNIYDHLRADLTFQQKSSRFLENHDEERAKHLLGMEKSLAAAVIISTIPGMRFFFDGQFEGKKIKLPVQLGREPMEIKNKTISNFYEKLFRIIKNEIFSLGNWELKEALPIWEKDHTNENLLTWLWTYNAQHCLVVVNYSNITSQGRIKINSESFQELVILTDLLNGKEYLRSANEVYYSGLFVELGSYQTHLFQY
ncbi:MAG: alpha-amylase family glycosyl hydrolase [Ignavibacteriaceae bacterium]|nr:alpha-amylase family glycosyl hydrolase [Ignavibacteriaceae bacterium]